MTDSTPAVQQDFKQKRSQFVSCTCVCDVCSCTRHASAYATVLNKSILATQPLYTVPPQFYSIVLHNHRQPCCPTNGLEDTRNRPTSWSVCTARRRLLSPEVGTLPSQPVLWVQERVGLQVEQPAATYCTGIPRFPG